MTKINQTPLARRVLNDQLSNLKEDPEKWQSVHLRSAFEIVAKRVPRGTAKEMVHESVRGRSRREEGFGTRPEIGAPISP